MHTDAADVAKPGRPAGVSGGVIVSFVLSLASTVLVSAGLVSGWLLPTPARSRLKRFLRPPAARDETEFLSLCIRCGQCANVCPNKCISLHGMEAGLENLGTPKIDARARGKPSSWCQSVKQGVAQ